jgi:hypothetical protein
LKKFKDNIKQLSKLREDEKKKPHFSFLDNRWEMNDRAELFKDDNDSLTSESEHSDNGSFSVTTESWKRSLTTRRLEARQDRKKLEANLVNTFNNIAAKTTQLIAIKDIKAEVDMLLSIMKEQLKVISAFAQSIPDSVQRRELQKMVRSGQNQVLKLNKMKKQSDDIFEAVYTPNFTKFFSNIRSSSWTTSWT